MNSETTNYGDVVACDFCNYGEESMGGVLIGSYAICGECCDSRGYYKDEHSADVTETFDTSKTFRDNVLEYRKKVYGSSDLIQTITSF
tara:strand:- start:1764 stop:2027 length:264 start_codon:yes stop_codon:yes gene_type:complete